MRLQIWATAHDKIVCHCLMWIWFLILSYRTNIILRGYFNGRQVVILHAGFGVVHGTNLISTPPGWVNVEPWKWQAFVRCFESLKLHNAREGDAVLNSKPQFQVPNLINKMRKLMYKWFAHTLLVCNGDPLSTWPTHSKNAIQADFNIHGSMRHSLHSMWNVL